MAKSITKTANNLAIDRRPMRLRSRNITASKQPPQKGGGTVWATLGRKRLPMRNARCTPRRIGSTRPHSWRRVLPMSVCIHDPPDQHMTHKPMNPMTTRKWHLMMTSHVGSWVCFVIRYASFSTPHGSTRPPISRAQVRPTSVEKSHKLVKLGRQFGHNRQQLPTHCPHRQHVAKFGKGLANFGERSARFGQCGTSSANIRSQFRGQRTAQLKGREEATGADI